jgi:hypothetical protein
MGFCRIHPANSTQLQLDSIMTPKAVEHLLTQEARLLARRDAPVIDQELEAQRQAALEIFFQWQDHMCEFKDLIPFCAVIERKVQANKALIKWELDHLD